MPSAAASQLKCRFNPQTSDSAADYWKKCHAAGRWSRGTRAADTLANALADDAAQSLGHSC